MPNYKIFILLFAVLGALAFTPPAPVMADQLKFAVISDIRNDAIDEALDFIVSQDVDFIIVAGDFYYGNQNYYSHFLKYGLGVNDQADDGAQLVYFALGNHDKPPMGDKLFQSTIAPRYPANGPAGSPPGTIFSFDRGECHFVITNPYWEYKTGGYTAAQLEWLEQDLAESRQPFKFVVGHEPAFPRGRHLRDSLNINPEMRDRFWQILSDNGAQAYFCGHTHHLSHMLNQGVYQFDAGQVRSGHRYVTIVSVDDAKATVAAYDLSGVNSILSLFSDDEEAYNPIFETIVKKEPDRSAGSTQILFEAESPDNNDGCFIQVLTPQELMLQ